MSRGPSPPTGFYSECKGLLQLSPSEDLPPSKNTGNGHELALRKDAVDLASRHPRPGPDRQNRGQAADATGDPTSHPRGLPIGDGHTQVWAPTRVLWDPLTQRGRVTLCDPSGITWRFLINVNLLSGYTPKKGKRVPTERRPQSAQGAGTGPGPAVPARDGRRRVCNGGSRAQTRPAPSNLSPRSRGAGSPRGHGSIGLGSYNGRVGAAATVGRVAVTCRWERAG